MALLDRIFGKQKTLSELDKTELRKEEILLSKARDRLMKKFETIGDAKKKLFDQGAATKAPELRKSLALQFEMKTQEQMLVARELNLRTKEYMTVARLRMMKESAGGKMAGRLNLTDKDVARITSMISDDGIGQEMYNERLDSILEIGAESDKDALANPGLTSAGRELMDVWNAMDAGELKDTEGFEAADEAVKKRSANKAQE